MKKTLKYIFVFIILIATSIFLTLYFNNNKVNASLSDDPRLKNEEIIIIDNSKNETKNKSKNSQESSELYEEKTNSTTIDNFGNNTAEKNNSFEESNTYTDKINDDRCYVDGNQKIVYHITECEQPNNDNSLCKYDIVNGKEEQGTVTRNKLKSDISYCSNNITPNSNTEPNTYTDKIDDDRCYVDGNQKIVYHITECQKSSNNDSLCKYNRANGKEEQGTVTRNKLKSDIAYCSNNKTSNSNTESKTYTDKVNDDRCYVDGNQKIVYHITECQKSSNNNSLCKYNKANGKEEQGTVARNKLKSEISYCTKSSVEDGSIIGATGFSATNSKKYLRSQASNNSKAIAVLKAGEPFKILDTNADDTWWKVEYNGNIGYVENAYAMINLPDYIPSIQYYMMNAENNIYTASGVKLSIYGKKLYKTGKVYNNRLERDEYIVPAVYSFAKKILVAQNIASKEGYGLKIYDAYRPKSVADETRDSLSELYYSNKTARNGMDYSYENGRRFTWGQGWFIAQNLSSHSVGSAIDVVLVDKKTGNELPAQSSIHDLSTASVKYYTPISGQTYVRSDLYSNKANQHTKDLDRIMLSTGMTNLASEWWHFQDNDAYRRIKNVEPYGLDFQPTYVVSSK